MKKLLGIVVLGLLFFSNVNAMPKWIGKAIKVCRANQDIDLSMVWFEDDGSVEEKIDFSLNKGDYVTLNRRTNKDQKWYVASNNYFPSKNTSPYTSYIDLPIEGEDCLDRIAIIGFSSSLLQ